MMVGGACCAPEAVAAGTCGPFRLSDCTGGKILVDNACRCPEGTTEDVASGNCLKPPPVTARSTKKKETACKKGFHRQDGRCVPNFRPRASPENQPQSSPGISIQIGPSFGGGRRGGGGDRGIGGGGGRVPRIGGGGGGVPRGGGGGGGSRPR
jgi:hypothetical protein